jgi:UDPglucose 6-dehydrogenase
LVAAACFADLGHPVLCADADEGKVASLRSGVVPFYEPGLQDLVAANLVAGRLNFTLSTAECVAASEVVFITVGTPVGPGGEADLRYVVEAARQIAAALRGPLIVVNKSTVPVGTGELVARAIADCKRSEHSVQVVSNPEFLREGSAVADFLRPDRIVIGSGDAHAAAVLRELYEPFEAPTIFTDVRTAEMTKYAANAFLATKISYINEIAKICQQVGVDVKAVVAAAGSDKRIGTGFMNAGLGFGGSCFPKDVAALTKLAESHGVTPRLLRAVVEVNRSQIPDACARIDGLLGGLRGRKIGVLGLAFKGNTDDVRESPALALVRQLARAGAQITAHDPAAAANARAELGGEFALRTVSSPYESLEGAAAAVVATDWPEYGQLDLALARKLMAGDLFVDGRNLYESRDVTAAGLRYIGIGRSLQLPEPSEVLT